jgi:aspartyl-tRNA(Asn)/glutamyl-tRNA(Gln) amidotransferase subunit C
VSYQTKPTAGHEIVREKMKDINNLAAMMKFTLCEDEKIFVSTGMDILTDSFKALIDVDTDGTLPMVSVLESRNIFREDQVVKTISRQELLAAAPEQFDGFFQVPRTLA